VIFDLLEPQPNINTNEHICSDLNVGRTESIETNEHITFSSDRYINLTTTIKYVNEIPKNAENVKKFCERLSLIQGPGWLNELGSWITKNYKKNPLDSVVLSGYCGYLHHENWSP
jgi:hypothetical protein